MIDVLKQKKRLEIGRILGFLRKCSEKQDDEMRKMNSKSTIYKERR